MGQGGGSSEPPEPSVDPPLLCITEPCRFKSTQKRTANVRMTILDLISLRWRRVDLLALVCDVYL